MESFEPSSLEFLKTLVDSIRPADAHDVATATLRIRALTERFQTDAPYRHMARAALSSLFASHHAGLLYSSLGLLPISGFFSETWHRIGHTLLPALKHPDERLDDALMAVFAKPSDELWVCGVEDADWCALLSALDFTEGDLPDIADAPPTGLPELLEGLTLISYRITVLGFEPELLHVDSALGHADSPFMAQNRETRLFTESCLTAWNDDDTVAEDEKQLLVMFDQCKAALDRLHRRAAQFGTSLRLTYKLQCLRDLIERGEQLALIAGALQADRTGASACPPIIGLLKRLVYSACHRNDLIAFWRQTLELTARRITEYAGKAGEHYITESRAEYVQLARAALGAGGLIALVALIKLWLGDLDLAPLNEMLAYGLNYGIGFAVIYMMGFTVATKQPAMTANALAASIGEATGKGKARNLDGLITLIARTTRSQLVAILGNVAMAVPMAVAVSTAFLYLGGQSAIDQKTAAYLLEIHHPLKSGSLFYAAVAGVCLFLSGLIAGYFDNYSTFNRIPERLKALGWAKRLFGQRRLAAFADYVEANLGALASNFLFGVMLGGCWGIGMLLGLPFDIRHIAFSSAFMGYALAAYDFSPPLGAFLWATSGVLLIGLINLGVSFSLALIVAMRARNVTFSQGRQLAAGVFARLWKSPREFFFMPPKARKTPRESAPPSEAGDTH
ncbi:MAG: site-specific recombinase [Zoogloeaceae bacterium]|jgi:site-specific recombinase|nr:site-specific recombinase [Zoogloeaceae bacterium]